MNKETQRNRKTSRISTYALAMSEVSRKQDRDPSGIPPSASVEPSTPCSRANGSFCLKGGGASGAVYQVVTDQIIGLLERGTVPWRKPWLNGPATRSYAGRDYRGINVMILGNTAAEHGLTGCWLTFNQAKKLGGRVKKGETSTPVIQWKWFRKADDEGELTGKTFPVCFYYRVFSICQTEGVPRPAWLDREQERLSSFEPVDRAQSIWDGYRDRPDLKHGGDRAAYWVYSDRITMPTPDQFRNAESYYATLFHEMAHSTGHKDRLNRKGIAGMAASFGSAPYSKEELIAEMGAAFLAAEAGIQTDELIEQSASYVRNWIEALRGDPRLAVVAAAQAQRAADHILGRKFDYSAATGEA